MDVLRQVTIPSQQFFERYDYLGLLQFSLQLMPTLLTHRLKIKEVPV